MSQREMVDLNDLHAELARCAITAPPRRKCVKFVENLPLTELPEPEDYHPIEDESSWPYIGC